MKPDGQNVEVTVEKIIDEDGQEQESAPHPKQVLYVALSGEASVYDILRRAGRCNGIGQTSNRESSDSVQKWKSTESLLFA